MMCGAVHETAPRVAPIGHRPCCIPPAHMQSAPLQNPEQRNIHQAQDNVCMSVRQVEPCEWLPTRTDTPSKHQRGVGFSKAGAARVTSRFSTAHVAHTQHCRHKPTSRNRSSRCARV